jgi:PAS domain S-box-containing protein
LFDAQGGLLLATSTNGLREHSCVAEHVRSVLQSKTNVVTDLHRGQTNEPMHFSLLCPIRLTPQTNAPADGVVLLMIDPSRYLYPFIRGWPVRSTTGETLLVRREGEEMVCLNEARHHPGTALNLRAGMTNRQVLAVQAGLGATGLMEGADYRSVPVMGVARKVQGTPWLVVAKMDRAEIYAPLQEDYLATGAVVGMAALVILMGLGQLWRQQRLRLLRQELAERRRVEAALRESETMRRAISDNMPDPAWMKDLSGRFLMVNDAYSVLTGRTAAETVGRLDSELFPPNVAAASQEQAHKVAATLKPIRLEVELPDAQRRMRVFDTVKAPVLDATGRIFATIGIEHDITERKQAEVSLRQMNAELEQRVAERTRELAQSEQRVRTIFRTSRDGILTTDAQGRCIDCNPAAVVMFGFPNRESLLAADLPSLFPAHQPDGRSSRDVIAANTARILAENATAFECVHQPWGKAERLKD